MAEKYKILECIGHGSFGRIYKVQRLSDGLLLAQKEIPFGNISRQEKQHIADEVNILRHLKHPNIVQYCGEEINRLTQVINIYMEYCDRGDLAKHIETYKEEKKRFPEHQVLRFFTQLLLALYRCHYGRDAPVTESQWMNESHIPNQSVLHRDIKPANVFLDEDHSVKLGDFGLSKLLDNTRTPYYMSPEIIRNNPYSAKSDIWALGCVMFEVCMLSHPFEGRSYLELQKNICQGNLSHWDRYYSDDLYQLIRHCLEIDCDVRPTTFQLLSSPALMDIRKQLETERLMKDQFKLLRKKQQSLNQRESEITLREQQLAARESELGNYIAANLAQQEEALRRDMEKQLREVDNRYQRYVQQMVGSMQHMQISNPQTDGLAEAANASAMEMVMDTAIETTAIQEPKLSMSQVVCTELAPSFAPKKPMLPITEAPSVKKKDMSSRALQTTATLMKHAYKPRSPIEKKSASLRDRHDVNHVMDSMAKLLDSSLQCKSKTQEQKNDDLHEILRTRRKTSKGIFDKEQSTTAVLPGSLPGHVFEENRQKTKHDSLDFRYIEKLEKLNLQYPSISKQPSKVAKTLHGKSGYSTEQEPIVNENRKSRRDTQNVYDMEEPSINGEEYTIQMPKKLQLLEGQKRSPVKQLARLNYNKLRRSGMDRPTYNWEGEDLSGQLMKKTWNSRMMQA
ncbi:NEK/NEK2 protein kinase Fin1 [Schizosaccharomyces cryophilus OY26]|uniref:non-specific serine/threonine protein kinase n=1 Tax=Schizosaccharomyces cryophilus (strain OY26 / ATCC MYA-4695 / CBS 11777 / NBRC 106824 / NRRL Y48691) TaxID=653667 RepID=S9VXK4_SCHCR|nr:NEK/NEK2 protein kinase Fin1 [Schizosaccharomyces cryophilus OY26]EPY50924.1 NEK/NEK2 protein kinase Fin1 [Schizosaccharomyces cryophilus OY26]